MRNQKYDVFISYRRKGGDATARLFYESLTKLGYRVSFDMETLRSGKFNAQLYLRIEECKDVVVLLSEGALDLRENREDDWFRLEIAHALKCGKNVVPVFLRDFKKPSTPLPDDIMDLMAFEGVTASAEHYDSTLQRIRKLLKACPHPTRIKKGFLLAATIVVCVAACICFWFCDTGAEDCAEAVSVRATNSNDARSQGLLGRRYLEGEGVEQNFEKAFSLLEKAAAAGDCVGQYNLGRMYKFGVFVNHSMQKALKLYRSSAEQGYAPAQNALGAMLEHGDGCSPSHKDAAHWYAMAAAQNEPAALCNLGALYFNGLGVVKSEENGREYFLRSAKYGYADAELNLGKIYLNGWGVEVSMMEAKKWLEQARIHGSAEATYLLKKINNEE